MSNKIYIGIDGSEPSRAALTWGVNRAAKYHKEVVLVYVLDDTFVSFNPGIANDWIEAGKQLANEELAYAQSLGLNVPIETAVSIGNPISALETYSQDADMIVIGSHKGSAVGATLLGTRGIKIAAVSHAPVAVIPTTVDENRNGVVVGVDRNDASTPALEFAAAEASRIGEPLIVVYAWEPPSTPGMESLWSEEIERSMRDEAERAISIAAAGLLEQYPDLVLDKRIVRGAPVSALTSQAKDASLLVVGNRGRKGLARLLLGSVSHGVLNHMPSPVVVARHD